MEQTLTGMKCIQMKYNRTSKILYKKVIKQEETFQQNNKKSK